MSKLQINSRITSNYNMKLSVRYLTREPFGECLALFMNPKMRFSISSSHVRRSRECCLRHFWNINNQIYVYSENRVSIMEKQCTIANNIYLPNVSIWLWIPSSVARMRREKETRDQKRGEEEEGETDDRIIKEIWKIMKDRETGCPPLPQKIQ